MRRILFLLALFALSLNATSQTSQGSQFQRTYSKSLDYYYGKTVGGIGWPWASTTEANNGIPLTRRYDGMTILVGADSSVSKEYWYHGGRTNAHLMVKLPDTTGLGLATRAWVTANFSGGGGESSGIALNFVTDFGGVGDGVTDNTAAFAAAMAMDASQYYLFIPGGVYKTHTVTLNPQLTILGTGIPFYHGGPGGTHPNGTTIKSISAEPLFEYEISDELPYAPGTIKGILFDGDGVGTVGLAIGGLQKFEYSHNGFINFEEGGIRLLGSIVGDVHHTLFENNEYDFDLNYKEYGGGLGLMPPNFLSLHENWHFLTRKYSIYAQGGLSMLSVDRCNFELCGTTSDTASGVLYFEDGAEGLALEFNRNYIERTKGFATVRIGASTSNATRYVFQNNQWNAAGDASHDIYVDATGSNKQRIIIENSMMRNGGGLTISGTNASVYIQESEIPSRTIPGGVGVVEVKEGNIYINGAPVTTGAADVTAPVLSTAEVLNANPDEIVLTYDEPLDAASIPATSDFAVSGGKTVTNVGVSGGAVTLTVNSDYTSSDVITVSYTPGANKIQDVAGNDAVSLTTEPVDNNISGPATIVLQDDFNRAANPSSLGNTDVPGTAWPAPGSGVWGIYTTGVLAYCSSETTSGAVTIYTQPYDIGVSDFQLDCVYLRNTAASGGFVLRYVDNNNYLMLEIASGNIILYEVIGGAAPNVIQNVTITNADGVPMDVTITANGTGIEVFKNSVSVLTATTSQFLTATQVGLMVVSGTGFGGGVYFDDLVVTD